MALPRLPLADLDEPKEESSLLLREGVADFGPRRTRGWATLRVR